MPLGLAHQQSSVTLKFDTTAGELMQWLAGYPSSAKVSASYSPGDRGMTGDHSLQVSWDPRKVADDIDEKYTNLDQAEDLINRIGTLKAVQKFLKDAFAHRELDGGAKAALDHELYLQAQAEIDQLEEELTQLI